MDSCYQFLKCLFREVWTQTLITNASYPCSCTVCRIISCRFPCLVCSAENVPQYLEFVLHSMHSLKDIPRIFPYVALVVYMFRISLLKKCELSTYFCKLFLGHLQIWLPVQFNLRTLRCYRVPLISKLKRRNFERPEYSFLNAYMPTQFIKRKMEIRGPHFTADKQSENVLSQPLPRDQSCPNLQFLLIVGLNMSMILLFRQLRLTQHLQVARMVY